MHLGVPYVYGQLIFGTVPPNKLLEQVNLSKTGVHLFFIIIILQLKIIVTLAIVCFMLCSFMFVFKCFFCVSGQGLPYKFPKRVVLQWLNF